MSKHKLTPQGAYRLAWALHRAGSPPDPRLEAIIRQDPFYSLYYDVQILGRTSGYGLVEQLAGGTEFAVFLKSYIETALWSSSDNSNEQGGEPLDKNYGPDDIAPEAMHLMLVAAREFFDKNYEDIQTYSSSWKKNASQAGHDFWLTRNKTGAGFWDGDYPEDSGQRLTQASDQYGEVDLYVGDDGLIYHG